MIAPITASHAKVRIKGRNEDIVFAENPIVGGIPVSDKRKNIISAAVPGDNWTNLESLYRVGRTVALQPDHHPERPMFINR